MKRRVTALVAALLIAATGFLVRQQPSTEPGEAPLLAGAPPEMPVPQRGEYLAKAADCVACHTAPGGQPFAGGLAFKLPFGRLYSSNITGDEETGIGAWTDDEFVRAMHEGVRKDGQRLYPAFPYTSYTQLSRTDILAIKAYLMSLPKIRQPRIESELSFPFNQRWGLAVWNALFFKNQRFEPDTARSDVWNTGAYLVSTLAHCAECHTPRNAAFGLKNAQALSGAGLDGWYAPNITSDPTYGIGQWSDRDVFAYLQTGHAPGRGSAGGPMGEAVAHSLQHLAPEDLAAIVIYLRSVPARPGDTSLAIAARPPQSVLASSANAPPRNTPTDLVAGQRLFAASCAGCHRWDGAGRQSQHAALLQIRSVNDPLGRTLTKMVLHGIKLKVRGTDVFMPSFGDSLSDVEIAQLANFVVAHYGGKRGEVTAQSVAEQRER